MSDSVSPTTLEAAEACCHRLAGVLFPGDLTRALELALLKTFGVPSISALLARTGEFEQRPRKRYDDTGLMVAELLRHGPGSTAGAAVIARMNRIHGHYAISNEVFLYVLSSFVAEPIRWLELNERVQRTTFRYAESNQRVAEATLAMLLSDWPSAAAPAAAPLTPEPAGGRCGRLSRLARGARPSPARCAAGPALPQPDLRRLARSAPRTRP